MYVMPVVGAAPCEGAKGAQGPHQDLSGFSTPPLIMIAYIDRTLLKGRRGAGVGLRFYRIGELGRSLPIT